MLFTTTCFQTYFYFQLKNFKCGDCGYTCYLKTDLERHIMNVHDKFRSPCPSCGKKYSDLRQHIRVVHEGAKVTLQFPIVVSTWIKMAKYYTIYFALSGNIQF